MVCCTHTLNEWERRCASSPRIPEELEPLGACGEPISRPESPTCLMGIKQSKKLLQKMLFPCPKQLCQRLDSPAKCFGVGVSSGFLF